MNSIVLASNPITSIAPLSGITGLDSLRINNTKLTSLNGLENVTYAANLFFSNNPNLRDISALANVAVMKNGTSDLPSQYTVKPSFGSPFCNGLDSGVVYVRNHSNGVTLTSADLCQ